MMNPWQMTHFRSRIVAGTQTSTVVPLPSSEWMTRRDPMRWARSVMPGRPREEERLPSGRADASNPTPSSFTRSRSPPASKSIPTATRCAAACRSTFDRASWAIRNSASSTGGDSRRSDARDSERRLELLPLAGVGQHLIDRSDQTEVVEDGRAQTLGDGAQLGHRVLHDGAEFGERWCIRRGAPGVRGVDLVDLAAQVDEGLQGPVVQLLRDVPALFLLAEYDSCRVGLHPVMASGLRRDVFEDDLQSLAALGRSQHGGCGPEQPVLVPDVEGDGLDPTGIGRWVLTRFAARESATR